MLGNFYNALLNFLTPFVKFVGKLHAPFSHKRITGEHYYKWRDSIKVGDVLLTKTRGELSNLINPTKIKHAGIYVGRINGDEICYVLEAVGRGVVLTDLVTFLTTKDVVVQCKPNFIREYNPFTYQVQEAALKYKGLPYDYIFKKGAESFYCFELAVACLKSAYSEVQLRCDEIVKGKRIYNHETFLDPQFFNVGFDSRKENG